MIIGTLTLLYPVLLKDQQTFSEKDQMVNILDFVSHMISIASSGFFVCLSNPLKWETKTKNFLSLPSIQHRPPVGFGQWAVVC